MPFRVELAGPGQEKAGRAALPLAPHFLLAADGNELCITISGSASHHDTRSSFCRPGGPAEPLGACGNRGAARLQSPENPLDISRSTASGILGYTGKKREY